MDGERSIRTHMEEALRTADRLGDTLLAALICEALEMARSRPASP